MDGRRVGRTFRTVRLELGMRQLDVAAKAGVSQGVVSLIERGDLYRVSIRALVAVAAVLDITLWLDARWHGGALDRLLDRDHAALVEYVAAVLRRHGWTVRIEYEFNQYGDRGSVDVLAWHPASRVLLIAEIKSVLTDLQATLHSFSRKVRIVPALVATREGWHPREVGRLLVVIGTRANRSVVAAHPAIFESSFPQDAAAARRWLRERRGSLAALWFVAPSNVVRGNRGLRAAKRFRQPRPSVEQARVARRTVATTPMADLPAT